MDRKDVFLLVVLFVISLVLWTLPIKDNAMPYSEADGCHHFSVTDYMSYNNKVVGSYPYYLGKYAQAYEGKMAYTPLLFIDLAVGQMVGGDRVVSFFVFLAILNFSIVFSVYFLVRKLYGLMPAFFSGLLLVFSGRDIMTHILGQWPALISFACVPLIIYCYYKYTNSYLMGRGRVVYLFLIPFLFLMQFGSHYQAIIHSVLILLIYTILLFLKERKKMFDYKQILLALVLLVVLVGPFISRPLLYTKFMGRGYEVAAGKELVDQDLGAMFKLYSEDVSRQSFPPTYFSYGAMLGWWTVPFAILGLLFLLLKRDRKALLMLSWVLGLYLIFHLDILVGFRPARIARSLIELPHLIFPLVVVGAFSIPSFFRLSRAVRGYFKYLVALGLLFLVLFFNAGAAYDLLDGAYPNPIRMNSDQYAAAEWLLWNVGEEADVLNVGTYVDKVARWIRTVSQRNVYELNELAAWRRYYPGLGIDYVMVDYSDSILMNNQPTMDQLRAFEEEKLGGSSGAELVYDQKNVKIYKVNNFEI